MPSPPPTAARVSLGGRSPSWLPCPPSAERLLHGDASAGCAGPERSPHTQAVLCGQFCPAGCTCVCMLCSLTAHKGSSGTSSLLHVLISFWTWSKQKISLCNRSAVETVSASTQALVHEAVSWVPSFNRALGLFVVGDSCRFVLFLKNVALKPVVPILGQWPHSLGPGPGTATCCLPVLSRVMGRGFSGCIPCFHFLAPGSAGFSSWIALVSKCHC